MTQLYANIGIAHENCWQTLERRVVAAAQCNADAVVINKSTPHLVIPDEKRYVSIQSRWGNKAYLEVARLSEIDSDNTLALCKLCDGIGIPLIWSVTDSTAAAFVKQHVGGRCVKLHHDAPDCAELAKYCYANFKHVIYSWRHLDSVQKFYGVNRRNFQVYYTTRNFPPDVTDMQLNVIDDLVQQQYSVGYESRDAGVFPGVAVAYKGVNYIEKYLGDPDSDNLAVLTPDQFYDFYKYLEILTLANHSETANEPAERQ